MNKIILWITLITVITLASCQSEKALDIQQFGREYTDAWNSLDPDNMASYFAEDGTLTINDGSPSRGRVELSATAQSFMEAFPDMELTMDSLVQEGENYRYHWTFRGTNSGPGGNGNPVDFSGHELWTMNADGLIQTSIGTFDQEEYDYQLLDKSSLSMEDQVKHLNRRIVKSIPEDQVVANLDHHGMAAEEDVYTPPAIVAIFSNSEINSQILVENIRTGLDLPFKILAYSEPDTLSPAIAITSGDFILRRHALEPRAMELYKAELDKYLNGFEDLVVADPALEAVDKDFGIVEIKSDFDFSTTVGNLKNIVNAQTDTRWFGEVDYSEDAKAMNIDLPPATLLLFGGPAPGAKAMFTTPRIGLDAFCQKLLVYEDEAGDVRVIFNDIVAFANLYYGTSTKPQAFINQRLTATFTKAVKK